MGRNITGIILTCSLTASSIAVGQVADSASSISQYGVTWTFDQDYPVGQFANGDWWVVGPVTINAITPDFTGTRNGWEINPSTVDQQDGYDSRTPFESSLVPSLPYTAQPGDSIVKVISNPDEFDCDRGWTTFAESCSRDAPLKTAGVLTVISAPVDEYTFRPPYAGTWKPLTFSYGNVRTEVLRNLAHVSGTPSLTTLERHVQRLQLDDHIAVPSHQLHPTENMGNQYGAYLTGRYSEIVLRLNLDDSLEDKRQLLVNFLQVGIDYYGMLREGHTWPADGGIHAGRKLPIFFAGYLFGDADMFNIGTTYPASTNTFQDDAQFFYTSENPPFAGAPNRNCYAALPQDDETEYGYARYGIRHAQDPENPDFHGEDSICQGIYSSYWNLNTGSQRGTAIAVEILGQIEAWGSKAIFDFFDRMQDIPTDEVWGSTFADNMYNRYHVSRPKRLRLNQ